jgi:hypothetical protein
MARAPAQGSLTGVGERMILIPELMKLGGAPIMPMVKDIADDLANHSRGSATVADVSPLIKRI